MTQPYMGALKQVERLMQDSLGTYSQNSMNQLHDLCIQMSQDPVYDVDYLKLMELYGRKYRKEKNEEALRFVVMRMQQVSLARQTPKRTYAGVVFTNRPLDAFTIAFLKEFPSLLHTYEERYKVRILQIATLVFVVALIVLVLLFHLSFLIIWLSLLLMFGVFVYYTFQYGYASIVKEQMQDLIQFVDPTLKKLDERQMSK
ncbi:hypothetical protein [Absicoccus intestinalis]|uniref:DUF1700 domain-containing protein n=1 Tax=Absicoccus intestinalis TaxID=2926319 RepID=A0ABU4WLQ5_9FIRM|nr:hypothetical protein [Absicoccus sp. CLA-KB-P134]MDX8417471.1 hypothetical protein [Absicoccus sp. CLA-KB-P134]